MPAEEHRSRTVWDVRPGESLIVQGGSDVAIELVHKSGQLARLRITAPLNVKIERRPCAAVPSMAT